MIRPLTVMVTATVRLEREADICIPLPSIDKRELMPGQRKKKAQSNCAFRYSEILQGRA